MNIQDATRVPFGLFQPSQGTEKIASRLITDEDIGRFGISKETLSLAVIMALKFLSSLQPSQIEAIEKPENWPSLRMFMESCKKLRVDINFRRNTLNTQKLEAIVDKLYPYKSYIGISVDRESNEEFIAVSEKLLWLFFKEIICKDLSDHNIMALLMCLANPETGLDNDQIKARIKTAPQRLLRSPAELDEFFRKPTRDDDDRQTLSAYMDISSCGNGIFDVVKTIITLGNKEDITQLCTYLSEKGKLTMLDTALIGNIPGFKQLSLSPSPLYFLLETCKDLEKAKILYGNGARECSVCIDNGSFEEKYIDYKNLLSKYGLEPEQETCVLF